MKILLPATQNAGKPEQVKWAFNVDPHKKIDDIRKLVRELAIDVII